MNAKANLKLLREIEANRAFILTAYQQNPELLARAEPRIRQLLQPLPMASENLEAWLLQKQPATRPDKP
ncbi:hypothetical protein GCM10023165_18570 [Variovorax defluvii]|uniref:Uncharacterized protein n=1 Tax=Variovorax defluvii TaxID=913761 RepID=A0ABP8HH98_9BURK